MATEANKTITQVLSEIQKTLKAPKSNLNKFGNYYYRSCEDILEAVKPLLPENISLVLSDKIELIGDRYYVKATATLLDGFKVLVQAEAYAREPADKKGSDQSQITGAASSYARKYALNGLFCIDDTKDADATNDHGKASKGNLAPVDKSPVHKEWKDAMDLINDAQDSQSVLSVGRYQWKRLKELGASENELEMIQDQTQNRATELGNRELDKAAKEKS